MLCAHIVRSVNALQINNTFLIFNQLEMSFYLISCLISTSFLFGAVCLPSSSYIMEGSKVVVGIYTSQVKVE